MNDATQPDPGAEHRRAPGGKRGARLILASNALLLIGAVVVLAGIVASSTIVVIAGVVALGVAIALSVVHARARRGRMAR